jgi:molecular chaperone GrpE
MPREIELTEEGIAADGDTAVNMNRENGAMPEGSEPEVETSLEESPDANVQAQADAPQTGSVPKATSAYIIALQADLEEARTRADDAEKRLIYAQAEFQNVLRRREEQYRFDQKYTNSELIRSLLPVLDNFERALKAAENARSFDTLIGGVSGTHKQLMTLLEKVGVTPIDAIGKEFNPVYHEAIGQTEDSDQPANTVAEEVQRGYMMHDRVLRPTLVKVAGG